MVSNLEGPEDLVILLGYPERGERVEGRIKAAPMLGKMSFT